MFYRKDAVALAALSMLASAGFVMAESKNALTLDSSVVNAAEAADRTLLMGGLDRIGAAQPLEAAGINVYGWVQGGYSANLRNTNGFKNVPRISGVSFNSQPENEFMLNQVVLRFERLVDMKKPIDIGFLVELMYGSDAGLIHSNGLEYGNNNAFNPDNQFDIPQAYVDISLGQVGNGLKFRVGKFATLLGYETIAPTTNPFYSHSYVFGVLPFTHTGVLGTYTVNDQVAITLGATRGWDQATEDINEGGDVCGWDVLGQVAWTPNQQTSVFYNFSVGPQNAGDTDHWRVANNLVITYAVNDRLKLALDGVYIADHAYDAGTYGDVWGAAAYASYVINEFFTFNARIEKLHDYRFGTTLNFYEATLGLTIKPFPKDPIGQNLTVRPEIRYDWSEDEVYTAGRSNNFYQDQWSAGIDFIFTF